MSNLLLEERILMHMLRSNRPKPFADDSTLLDEAERELRRLRKENESLSKFHTLHREHSLVVAITSAMCELNGAGGRRPVARAILSAALDALRPPTPVPSLDETKWCYALDDYEIETGDVVVTRNEYRAPADLLTADTLTGIERLSRVDGCESIVLEAPWGDGGAWQSIGRVIAYWRSPPVPLLDDLEHSDSHPGAPPEQEQSPD